MKKQQEGEEREKHISKGKKSTAKPSQLNLQILFLTEKRFFHK